MCSKKKKIFKPNKNQSKLFSNFLILLFKGSKCEKTLAKIKNMTIIIGNKNAPQNLEE